MLRRAFRRISDASSSDTLSQSSDDASKSRRSSVQDAAGSRFGLKEWIAPDDANIDVIFIHGLNGHPEKSWTAENGICWPKDLLPNCIPDIRALITAKLAGSHHDDPYGAIFLSTHGIMFFGTPHQGGNNIALGRIIASVASIGYYTNTDLLDHLEKESEWLEQLTDRFRYVADQFEIKFCYETFPLPGMSKLVVDKQSAIIPGQPNAESIEIHKDHRQMIKMSEEDPEFDTISNHLLLLSNDAVFRIQARWEQQPGLQEDRRASLLSNPGFPEQRELAPIITEHFRLASQLGSRVNPFFTGREDALTELDNLLAQQKRGESISNIVAVLGTGGIGKTQLVRQYASTRTEAFSSISWINCQSLETVYKSFNSLAQRIVSHYVELNTPNVPPFIHLAQHLNMTGLIDGDGRIIFNQKTRSLVVEALKRWLCAPNNTEWLLIFDNVDDLDSFNISDFFPEDSGRGHITVTSRRPECGHWGEVLELEVFREVDSLDLLLRSSKSRGSLSDEETEEAVKIVNRLGHLPLAIHQAGTYLHATRMSLSKYVALLRPEKIRNVLSYKPPAAVWDYSESVFSTWELSFTEVRGQDEAAAELLALCSFYSNECIGIDMLQRGLDHLKTDAPFVESLMIPLLSFSLITRKSPHKEEDVGSTFSIHPLVHDWARERLSPLQKAAMAEKAFRIICSTLEAREIWTTGVRTAQDWNYEREIMPHLDASLHWFNQLVTKDTAIVEHIKEFMLIANVYYYAGNYTDAERLYLKVLEYTEEKLGPDHTDTLSVLQGLATVNRFQGKWDESYNRYQRVLDGRNNKDPNDLDTLATVQSMAVLYRHTGLLDKSIQLYHWALYGKENDGKGIESQQGATHPNTIHTILGYAIVLQFQGKFAEALPLYERVCKQRTKALGPHHPDTLTAMHNLADDLRALNQLERAKVIFSEVLEAREMCLGMDHPDTLRTAHQMAKFYPDLGLVKESDKYYAQVLVGREQRLGPDHPDTLSTILDIAGSYQKQGRPDEARKYYARALRGHEAKGGLGLILEIQRTVDGLRTIVEEAGEDEEIERLYARALNKLRDTKLSEDPGLSTVIE
ncbi:Fc.00g031430.m01.CDS01 [Cosmosporella sp. VM-42]